MLRENLHLLNSFTKCGKKKLRMRMYLGTILWRHLISVL